MNLSSFSGETSKGITFHADAFINEGREYKDYLTPPDWKALQTALVDGYEPSPAGRFLARAHELFDAGNGRYAFIEAVTGLELAIGELIRRNFTKGVPQELIDFENLPVKKQFAAVAALSGLFDQCELAAGLKVIEMRNAIVHEGKDVPQTARKDLYDFLNAVARILKGPGFKFASASGGNLIMPSENWDRL